MESSVSESRKEVGSKVSYKSDSSKSKSKQRIEGGKKK